MLLKTDYSLDMKTIEALKKIIGASVSYIVAEECWHQFHTDKFIFGSKIKLILDNTEDFSCLNLLSLQYIFNEIVGDEVNNIRVFLENNVYYRKDYPSLLNYQQPFLGCLPKDKNGNPFTIKSIKIYGEERTRKWGDFRIRQYFSLKEKDSLPPTVVKDYLCSNEFVVLENQHKEKLIFQAERGNISLRFSGKVEPAPDDVRVYFYEKYELDDTEEMGLGANINSDLSDEVRLKLHHNIE